MKINHAFLLSSFLLSLALLHSKTMPSAQKSLLELTQKNSRAILEGAIFSHGLKKDVGSGILYLDVPLRFKLSYWGTYPFDLVFKNKSFLIKSYTQGRNQKAENLSIPARSAFNLSLIDMLFKDTKKNKDFEFFNLYTWKESWDAGTQLLEGTATSETLSLKKLKVGQSQEGELRSLELSTFDGERYEYKVRSVQKVASHSDSIFN